MERFHHDTDYAGREAISPGFTLAKIYHDLVDQDEFSRILVECSRHHKIGKTSIIEHTRATISEIRELFSSQSVGRLAELGKRKLIFSAGLLNWASAS